VNLIRKWRRIMAVGCTHGDLSNQKIQKQVLDFKKKWKPEITVELGDLMDTATFRHGAKGTVDEGREVESDQLAAVNWLLEYDPDHIFWGNHDARLNEWMNSPNAAVAHAARVVWAELTAAARKVHAKTYPYDYEKGWAKIGGHYFGHGYWFNEQAVRDHSEYLGAPCVIAHLHAPQQVNGRTRLWSPSFCVGTLASIEKMTYARRRRATSRWGSGCVFGYVTDSCGGASQLWLASAPKDEDLVFPL